MTRAGYFTAGRQAHRLRIFENRPTLDELDPGTFERRRIGKLEAGNLTVLIGDELLPVENRRFQGPAIACCILEIVGEPRGIDEELLGNAAADHAGAADPVFFGDYHPSAVLRCNSRRPDSARARADDEKVEVVLSHFALAGRRSDLSGG